MNRYDQIERFKKLFPGVSTSTVNGTLMLQGFINGFNAGQDRFITERTNFRYEVKKLNADIDALKKHIESMNSVIKIQEKWQSTGEEI